MVSFAGSPDEWQRLDWRLLQNGFVTLFWRSSVFQEAREALADAGYQIIGLDAARWVTNEMMHDDLQTAFGFPDYYGRNFNALADCLDYVARFDYGSDAATTGTVVAIDDIDLLAERSADVAQGLLDHLAGAGRTALMVGHRLIVLARSNNPAISFEPVGAMPVTWNSAEFQTSARGL